MESLELSWNKYDALSGGGDEGDDVDIEGQDKVSAESLDFAAIRNLNAYSASAHNIITL